MAEYAGQSISHAIVAAVVIEALVRLWRITEPGLRMAFRLLPLAYPLAVLPAFLVLAPARGTEAFRDDWALFAGGRWAALGAAGIPVGPAVFAALAALGTGLFLRDALRLVGRAGEAREMRSATVAGGTDALAREVGEVAALLGVAVPWLHVVDTGAAVLLVTGIRRPTLIVSRGTLARLDARERRAALAHEMAHLARRDPLLGWVLMACRLVAFFNPAVQLAARAAVRELEWRADDLAAAATGDRAALASGLDKLAGATEPAAGPPRRRRARGLAEGLLARARAEAIQARRRRLVEPRPGGRTALAPLRLGLTGSTLPLVLFFVV